MTRTSFHTLGAGLGLALVTLAPLSAQAIDWSSVPVSKKMVLLYPAQTSFEWSLTPKDHSAAQKFKEGKNCQACHIDEEEKYGVPLASGLRWEPTPIPGKRGAVPLQLQFAHDDKNFYVRAQWKDSGPSDNPKMDEEFPVKLSLLIDDGTVSYFTRAGCWAVCHDDQTGMASAKDAEREKYLAHSRTKIRRSGGGDNLKSQADLDKMLSEDQYLELWQARLKPGEPPVVVDGYILEERHENPQPAVSAESTFENGTWTAVMSRPLTGAGPHHKDIVPGKTYTIGLSLHEDFAGGRFHQVSWEFSLALDGGQADFVADKH